MDKWSIRKKKQVLLGIFSLVFALLCFDIVTGYFYPDFLEESEFSLRNFLLSSVLEFLTMVLTGAGIVVLWSWYSDAFSEAKSLSGKVLDLQTELKLSKQELSDYLNKFREHLNVHFIKWELSKSESEVCLLLLKGLSFKEIAAIRSTSERTVRNQASIVYDKADISGRHELSAIFLNELLQ